MQDSQIVLWLLFLFDQENCLQPQIRIN